MDIPVAIAIPAGSRQGIYLRTTGMAHSDANLQIHVGAGAPASPFANPGNRNRSVVGSITYELGLLPTLAITRPTPPRPPWAAPTPSR
ncbi:hypothetical protein [Comamonas serinivorans]|nr:hypothetical protein [Comamonas serinivorans]